MRSCVSLTLVLLATLSSQGALASEHACAMAQPLTRLLLSVARPASAEVSAAADQLPHRGDRTSPSFDTAIGDNSSTARLAVTPATYAALARSSAELAASQPCHGP